MNIAFGALSATSLSFTYSAASVVPTITSLNATSANPGIKSILEINGYGFGTDASLVKVFLSNSSGKVYPLRVITIEDTKMKVGLSGGLTGSFKVQITLPMTNGDSIAVPTSADSFEYVNSITSISPLTGSFNGGTLVTITGTNFSPDDTIVSVGSFLNWNCKVEQVTSTSITCRTPPIHPLYSVSSGHKIIVATKLVVDSVCPGNNCNFVYMDEASSPKLTSSSATIVNAIALTLNGTNFIDASNTGCKVNLLSLVTGKAYEHSTTSCNATNAVFTVLKTVPSGTY